MRKARLYGVLRVFICAVACAATAIPGFAQLTQTGVHGSIHDPSGAVVPNATAKLTGPGFERTTVSASDGGFVFPDLQTGTYQLTVSAQGFQSTVMGSVVVDSGRITDLSVKLAIGAATETVEVSAVGAQLETSSNEIGTTISNNAIQNLPYSSRDVLMFSLYMAGNTTANDASGRNSTFNGLPNASLNISIDGMNNNSQRFKSGGTSMYAFAPERIDAIEQVTVSTTGLSADGSANGAMNIRFTTKRGTDQYHFSVGEQFANEDLNANSFFNNLRGQPISRSRQNNPYGSIGGPLVPFIPSLRHKLYFFAYFEAQPQPTSTTSNTTVLTPAAQAGSFTYIGTDGATRTVNLLQAAGAAGFSTAIDPTISRILGQINSSQSNATGFLNVTSQPYFSNMLWTQAQNTQYLFPTARVDYQITPKISWRGTWNMRHQTIAGGPNYPGMTQYNYGGAYKINAYIATNAVDWQITSNMLNNITFGVQSNGEFFYQGSDPTQWSVYGNRNIVFPAMTINTGTQTVNNASASAARLSPVVDNQTPFIRNNPVYQLRDDLNWVKGRHTILIGGMLLHTSFYETSYGSAGVPNYNLGIASGDPVATALQNALPNINTSNGDVTNATALYAFLTGRLSSISGSNNVNEQTHQYSQFAPVTQRFAFTTGGLYVQDNWRVNPHLTLNYGLRWEFDGPIKNTNGIDSAPTNGSFLGPSTGLFAPGSLGGVSNPQLAQQGAPYKSDLVNPSPNVGIAWNPKGEGMLGKFLGGDKTVFRAGASITYYNEGMNAISNVISANQGSVQSISATPGGAGFPIGGVNLSSPTPPLTVTPSSFGYPVPLSNYAFTGSQALYYVNPNLVTPYTTNWNIGVQREIPFKTVIEVRYIGNKSTHMWHYQNVNEANVFENGFLPQFIQAQQNLSINQANGKGATFINNGLAGQAGIPIFDAAFGGNGSLAPLAASSGYASSTLVTYLQQGLAGSMAGSLASTTSTSPGYYCRLVGSNFAPCAAAGFTTKTAYPLNFWTPNPYASSLNYQSDDGNVTYNGLQIEARKAYSHGFTGTTNFTWSHGLGDLLNASDQSATYQWLTQRNARLSYGPTPFDRRLAFNAYWTYELPVGKGRDLNINNPVLDRVFGGWALGGTEQIATGSPSLLNSGRNTVNNLVQGGVVLGSGLTLSQLQHDLSSIPDVHKVVSGNLISNVSPIAQSSGIANPAYYGPASTPGAFSQLLYMYGTTSFALNMSLNKTVRIHEKLNVGFRLEALNFLNHPFFPLGSTTVTGNTFGQVSSATGNRTVLLRAFMSW